MTVKEYVRKLESDNFNLTIENKKLLKDIESFKLIEKKYNHLKNKCICPEKNDDNEKIKNENTELRSTITKLQNEIQSLNSVIENLNAEISSLKSKKSRKRKSTNTDESLFEN